MLHSKTPGAGSEPGTFWALIWAWPWTPLSMQANISTYLTLSKCTSFYKPEWRLVCHSESLRKASMFMARRPLATVRPKKMTFHQSISSWSWFSVCKQETRSLEKNKFKLRNLVASWNYSSRPRLKVSKLLSLSNVAIIFHLSWPTHSRDEMTWEINDATMQEITKFTFLLHWGLFGGAK